MDNEQILDVTALEASAGRKPPAADLKVIDHLDELALTWLDSAIVGCACIGPAERLHAVLIAADDVCATAASITIPLAAIDGASEIKRDAPFGSLWLLPGMRESLRVNGRIDGVEGDTVTVAVTECFAHCGKALIRSSFWSATETVGARQQELAQAVASSQLLLLATAGDDGTADLSPKGDPAGALLQLIDEELCFPDRPGNRRTDSFRNILRQPRVALIALTPGSSTVVTAQGVAMLTTDRSLRERFAVDGKVPTMVTRISALVATVHDSHVLQRVRPWPVTAPLADLNAATLFAAHVKANKAKSISARIAKALVAIPGALNKELEKDYKKNLY
ncbi:MAG: pyridoxamine 5'-phosphate oxidase family protein [Pseudomonadota bacterium]